MSADALYGAALSAAFWVALLGARAGLGSAAEAARLVFGLALGALLGRGAGLLWVPVGLLVAAPWRVPARGRFLGAALPALPASFAVAKLGCLAAGCCAAAGVEALGFAALGAGLALARAERADTIALAGLAAVRLAALPLRPEARDSAWLALGWLAFAALRCRPERGDDAHALAAQPRAGRPEVRSVAPAPARRAS